MNEDLVRLEVLTCANEDYSLLYELVAGLRNRLPSTPESELIKLVRDEIGRQLKDGWIEVFKTPSWIDQSRFIPIPKADAEQLISADVEFQYRPDRDPKLPCYWIGATPLGKSVWRHGDRKHEGP